jgi:hypothetical protein
MAATPDRTQVTQQRNSDVKLQQMLDSLASKGAALEMSLSMAK